MRHNWGCGREGEGTDVRWASLARIRPSLEDHAPNSTPLGSTTRERCNEKQCPDVWLAAPLDDTARRGSAGPSRRTCESISKDHSGSRGGHSSPCLHWRDRYW